MNLPGWFCGHCGIFNGEAKAKRAACRACDKPRMKDRSREFKLSLQARNLCVTCGADRPAPGITRCTKCANTNKHLSRRWRKENPL